jgi:hypothetical protein
MQLGPLLLVVLASACGYPAPARSVGDAREGSGVPDGPTGDGNGCPTGSMTFAATGAAVTVPLPGCVTSITVDLSGAAGGAGYYTSAVGSGGLGARVQGSLAIATESTLYIFVGSVGGDASAAAGGSGGFNGGGSGDLADTVAGASASSFAAANATNVVETPTTTPARAASRSPTEVQS